MEYTVAGWNKIQREAEITGRLSGPIKEILAFELAAGNQIVEASDGWPTQKANIWLKNRFAKDYRALYPSLKYSFVNDAHYWLDDYYDAGHQELIAVRWSLSHVSDPPET